MSVGADVPQDVRDRHVDSFAEFFDRYYAEEIAELARSFPHDQRSLFVDFSDLEVYDHALADQYRDDPDQFGEYAEDALAEYDLPVDVDLSRAHVRVEFDTDRYTEDVDFEPAERIAELVPVRGLVENVTKILPKAEQLVYECQRCGTDVTIPANSGGPHECKGCEREGPWQKRPNAADSRFVNHQRIRLQLPPDKVAQKQDAKMVFTLEDDLCGAVFPGDRVEVAGVQRLRESDAADDEAALFEAYGEAESVQVRETDFEDVPIEEHADVFERHAEEAPFESLVGSILPSHEGDEVIKLALGLQLFGMPTISGTDGSTIRGNSHIALIGDPGVGKSSLLKYIDDVAPRSVFTSGEGSTAAGLTASAVRDDMGAGDQWTVRGGAMVKADRGIACIDELDKMDDEDRSAMHEALEEQTVSISKAGMNPTLSARTTLLAAANPQYGRFDPYENIADQLDLAPPLLSRFDLIFTLSDAQDDELDSAIAERKNRQWSGGLKAQRGDDLTDAEAAAAEPVLSQGELRAWVAYARKNVVPVPTGACMDLLEEKHLDFRKANDDGVDGEETPVPVTHRKLEALQRLATASARVRLSDTVTEGDAERAIRVVEASLADVGVDPETDELDADIIETGTSKAQRERIRGLAEIVDVLADEHDDGAPIDAVLDEAESEGIERSKAEHEIEKLKEQGELYCPTKDHLRTL